MDDLAKLLSALASLAWPLAFAALLFKLFNPIYALVESARGRKFTIKVGGNELTMDEASAQQRVIVSDLQNKLAEMEKRLGAAPPDYGTAAAAAAVSANAAAAPRPIDTTVPRIRRILWVDDNPKNNSFLVAALEDRGAQVDVALSTDAGVAKFKRQPYDIVLSDMGRPEGERAGIDLAQRIKQLSPSTPMFIFCSAWAARHLREDALNAGVTEITASGTTLLSALPLANPA
jgi:CheY-like chemotaxis protein